MTFSEWFEKAKVQYPKLFANADRDVFEYVWVASDNNTLEKFQKSLEERLSTATQQSGEAS